MTPSRIGHWQLAAAYKLASRGQRGQYGLFAVHDGGLALCMTLVQQQQQSVAVAQEQEDTKAESSAVDLTI